MARFVSRLRASAIRATLVLIEIDNEHMIRQGDGNCFWCLDEVRGGESPSLATIAKPSRERIHPPSFVALFSWAGLLCHPIECSRPPHSYIDNVVAEKSMLRVFQVIKVI